MNEIIIKGSDIIILAILVLAVGNAITQKVELLRKFSIPIAVTGGLLCSIVIAIIATFGATKIVFDLTIRDTLLMVFFTRIGISAKFSRLAAGACRRRNEGQREVQPRRQNPGCDPGLCFQP